MAILDLINSMHGGRGPRFLTEEGKTERHRRYRLRMAELRINQPDYQDNPEDAGDIEPTLFAPEHEGLYWAYTRAVPERAEVPDATERE